MSPQLATVATMLLVAILVLTNTVSADGSIGGVYDAGLQLAERTGQSRSITDYPLQEQAPALLHKARERISRKTLTGTNPTATIITIGEEIGFKTMMYCSYHAKNPAVVQCNQCARWLCPACDHRVRGFPFCQDCIVAGVELLRHQSTSPTRS
jgi:hypothetical protein